MDPLQQSTNSRPSGIPRPSRLPVLRTVTSQSSVTPKQPITGLKSRPAASALSSSTSSVRPVPTTQFKEPAPRPPSRSNINSRVPAQTKTASTRTGIQSAKTRGTTNKTTQDELGDLDGFRSASRASSRAASRTGRHEEDTPFVQDAEPSEPAPRKSRPSLAERTMESIAKIPPSPANRRRRSSFFQQDSPLSKRPESAAGRSRAGSQEDVPIRPLTLRPKAGTKPRTSLGPGLSTPAKRSVSTAGSSRPSVVAQSPAPPKSATRRPLTGSKTVAARPTRTTRPALAGLFNAPNGQSDVEVSSSKDKSPSNPKKSSAALREQIKAARAAKKSIPANTTNGPAARTQAQSFDFDFSDDPFNQLPKDGKQVLRKRVDVARSEGKLNIAGMGFKEVPEEILKMYDYEFNKQQSGIVWNEVVDLTKFIAADNELEAIADEVFPDIDPVALNQDDESPGPQFGGIDHLDLHGNLLTSIPIGLRRLERLTSLNLSRNRLTNDVLNTISHIPSLRDVKISENSLTGELNTSLTNLTQLEVLEIHGNKLTSLPQEINQLIHLRILNIANNSIASLPMASLSQTSLASLYASKNNLSGSLTADSSLSFPKLQNLDLSINSLTSISIESFTAPSLKELNLSFNRLTSLPSLSQSLSLLSLFAEDNNISTLPDWFFELTALKIADFTGNAFSKLDPRIGLMASLESFKVAANPIRERKFLTMGTGEMKRDLRARLGSEDRDGDELGVD